MREQPYDTEAMLQRLLAEYPGLLAGDQIDAADPRRWLLVRREARIPAQEAGTDRWSVDHLFVDQDAVPTLVEVKRSSDTRIRREVVGQMLDYAANAVVYWPVERLRAEFEEGCRAKAEDPDQRIASTLGTVTEPDAFWQKVKTNLQAGRVRLVFVADHVPVELRRVVEFLNTQMDPAEVLAIEIRQFRGEGVRTLVPTVLGQTAEAQQRKGTSAVRKQWDEASYFEELNARVGPTGGDVGRRILEWARPRVTRIYWGQGTRSGSFVPILDNAGTDVQLFAVYTHGSLELYFQYYRTKPPFDDEKNRRELLDRLNVVPGVALPADAIDRRPSLSLQALADRGTLDGVLGVFDWFLQQIKAG